MYSSRALAKAAQRAHFRHAASRIPGRTSQTWGRNIATKSDVNKQVVEKLPLAGIKVLDMTRVLAGVCECFPDGISWSLTPTSHTVHRFLEIWGKQ